MRILLTGASSFTGFWFAQKLSAAGHQIVAPLRAGAADYAGVRGARVRQLKAYAEVVWAAPFGEARFQDLLNQRFDLFCHHAARVTGYRSPDFDVVAALADNTRNLAGMLKAMRERGLRAMVLTGSVFEAGEGAGEPPLAAFSPYGVSKEITASVVRYWCNALTLPLGKFVIPNPFGPFEEPRFCHYLVDAWRRGDVAEVRTPLYVRDNIHVELLADCYRAFCQTMATQGDAGPLFSRRAPSGYVESQGAFAQRFAAAIGPRLGLHARVKLLTQTDFSEPLVRINTEPAAISVSFDENRAWDALADYYRTSV